jgi:hypothetical protein
MPLIVVLGDDAQHEIVISVEQHSGRLANVRLAAERSQGACGGV